MYWKLKILYKDGRFEEITVKRVFQQRMNQDENIGSKLYYEDIYAEHGRGKWLNTDEMECWELEAR